MKQVTIKEAADHVAGRLRGTNLYRGPRSANPRVTRVVEIDTPRPPRIRGVKPPHGLRRLLIEFADGQSFEITIKQLPNVRELAAQLSEPSS